MKQALQIWLWLLSGILVFAPIVRAQQVATVPPGQTTQTAPPIPPDQKAYNDARRITDPQKKIDALEKLISDFPDGFQAFQARNDVLDTLIKSFPNEKDKIRAAAERILRPQGVVITGGSTFVSVATKLMEAGMFLEWAEEITKKGSIQFEQENEKSVRRQRARFQDALARIYLKQGKQKEAKKYFQQALANEPTLTTALLGLGHLAANKGEYKTALEYFSSVAVKAPLKKPDRQLLETAYRETHKGSLVGLEEMLDAKYRQLNAGLRFDHYQPPAKRTTRTTLAELFTGSGCGPCVAADLGFDALLERYNRQDLVVLVYHLHIPLPDPMTNPAAVERGKYYAVPGTPTSVVNGTRLPSGGGSREMTKGFYDRINPKVEKEMESPAEAEISLTATLEGDQVKATVKIDQIKASSDLKLHVVLAEDELRYTGENGIRFHPMVVRSLAGKDYAGFSVAASGTTNVEWTFNLKEMSDQLKAYLDTYEQQGHRGDSFTFSEKKFQIDPTKLSLVAFVQNAKTKSVLQTVYLKVKPAATASARAAAH
jgi:TolA-binding protein